MAELMTREPTGLSDWPLILVEGEVFSGPLELAVALSTSRKVGETIVFDRSGRADALADVGLHVISDDWATRDAHPTRALLADVMRACDLPVDGVPNVIVVDFTDFWDLLKIWVNWRAHTSLAAVEAIKHDPHVEIEVPGNLWNDADDRMWKMIKALIAAPAIAVLVASSFRTDDGRYKVDVKQSILRAIHAQVRCTRGAAPRLIGAPKELALPAGGVELDSDNPLEQLVFTMMADALTFKEIPATAVAPAGDALAEAEAFVAQVEAAAQAVEDASSPCRVDGVAGESAGEENASEGSASGTAPADPPALPVTDPGQTTADLDPDGLLDATVRCHWCAVVFGPDQTYGEVMDHLVLDHGDRARPDGEFEVVLDAVEGEAA